MAAMAAILDFQSERFQLFYLKVTPLPPTRFQVNWPFGQEKKLKIDFQDGCHGGHLVFPIGRILAIFDL